MPLPTDPRRRSPFRFKEKFEIPNDSRRKYVRDIAEGFITYQTCSSLVERCSLGEK